MNVEVLSDRENVVFSRREVEVKVDASGATPSREAIAKELALKLGVSAEAVCVVRIVPSYGVKSARVLARVYSSKEQLEKTEPKFFSSRGKKKEEAKKE
ncbi:MAG: 30S ribosomal protein S24e [Candidatus Micrarchaeia archaeon]